MLSPLVLSINLALVAGLILFVWDAPVRKGWARHVAVLLVNALILSYLYWRTTCTLPAFAWSATSLWAWFFYLAEMFAIVYEVWSLSALSRITDHSAQADVYERRLRQLSELPTVDVLIPSYSEGEQILRDTLRGAKGLDYPAERLRIWVLDDSRRPWLESLCTEQEVGYFARPTNEHGKAGNLNYAFPRTSGEYLLIIDADFVLENQFLFRTLGFLMNRPDLGIVQTPQCFVNPDPVQHNLLGGDAWTEEQNFFMTVVQSSRDAYGNAFCVGSGWLVRRSCLDELGGFPQGSICEDLEVTYALIPRGYRTLFLNEPLAFGLAPESVPEYIKQRVRWCSGTMQHAYLETGPFRGRGLTLLDRLFYFEPILYWLTFPFILLLMVAPILFWFTGLAAMEYRGSDVLLVVLPRFLASAVIMYWLSERKILPPITTIHRVLPAFHLTAALAKSLLSPFGSPFKVTSKGQARDRVVVQWPILRLFLALMAALIAGMFINLTGFYQVVEISEWTALDIAWSFFSLLILGLCALVCVERPKEAYLKSEERDVRGASLVGTARALLKSLFS